ncbi:MAG: signal recognition particle-docking protein FtsY [Rickettsiales bacterium]|nr:signal recognition particle-docking protein FtsY [Rickettsiales bacterium]
MKFLTRLKSGFAKTSGKLTDGISGIFTKAKLDDETIEALEELLIASDMGARLAAELSGKLAAQRMDKEITVDEVRQFLAQEIASQLTPYAKPLKLVEGKKPTIILVVGVNGNGKTTTIGKLAHAFKEEGKSVMLAGADTFRAAAIEQLQVWGDRSNIEVVSGEANSDPASVAYRACEKAVADKTDVLLIDTAGRLHNKSNLMDELGKIYKVIQKVDPSAPHHVIQVLDATTGQNALSQLQAFKEIVHVSGLIVTKLDGTAKGGIMLALTKQFALPIHAIGIGESIQDLGPFDPAEAAKSLLDIND